MTELFFATIYSRRVILIGTFCHRNSIRSNNDSTFFVFQVIDAKSQTPFVKQVNRMIVLLSRARLGMFVLANIGYFEEKPDPAIRYHQIPERSDLNLHV